MFDLKSIGRVRSPLVDRAQAPKQGNEGSPEAWLEFRPEFREALADLAAGDEILVLTWLDRADRETLSESSALGPRTGRILSAFIA
jgi:tRNA (Thr-GGU) A37 N-methylase